MLIDLLAVVCGVTYESAWPDCQIFEIDGTEIPIASKQTLIATKNTTRPYLFSVFRGFWGATGA